MKLISAITDVQLLVQRVANAIECDMLELRAEARRLLDLEEGAADTPYQLQALLKLYRPNVRSGNYQGDVAARGRNEALVKVAVVLGLESEEGMHVRFRQIDHDAYERNEAAIARINAEDRARRESQAA